MNPRVRHLSPQLLCDNWYRLYKYSFEYQKPNGEWELQHREAYDRGNGAAILLYNRARQTVILTRQFRLPSFVNGNADGMLIEACAGLLDKDNPRDCIVKEAQEETGYRISDPRKVFEAYMSPGSVTELLHFFVAEYAAADKVAAGGGLADEQEHIEVLELEFTQALAMMASGEIRDGKTLLLLQYAQIHGLLALP